LKEILIEKVSAFLKEHQKKKKKQLATARKLVYG